MGKQYNKVLKRRRRKAAMKRKQKRLHADMASKKRNKSAGAAKA